MFCSLRGFFCLFLFFICLFSMDSPFFFSSWMLFLGLFLFNKTRSAHAKKLRVSQGPRLLPSTELLFNTFWVKIIPSEPNTDWQPNIKQSHFVNSFTEVQMPKPTPLCSATTAVFLGFFFYKIFWREVLVTVWGRRQNSCESLGLWDCSPTSQVHFACL